MRARPRYYSKKSLLALTLTVLLALVLSACAAPAAPAATTGGEAAAAPEATEAAAAETATEAAAPAEAGAAPVEITVWHMEQPPHRVARFQKLIDEFNAANPDIVVKQEPQNWGEIYAKAPAAACRRATAPDMLFAIPDFTPILKDLGTVQPRRRLRRGTGRQARLHPSAVAPYSYDGGVWAVPLYNMADATSGTGRRCLTRPASAVPTTWDEWRAAAETLTKDGQYGIGLPANKQLYTDQTVYDGDANGGASEIYNEDGTLRFDNPETAAAYDFYNKLYKFSPPDAPNWTWGEAEACFANRDLRHDAAVHGDHDLRHAGRRRCGRPGRGRSRTGPT